MYEVSYLPDSTRLQALYALCGPDGEVIASTDQGFCRRDLVDACLRLNTLRSRAL